MNEPWPRVTLADLLVQDTGYVDAPEPRVYPKLSVRLYGKGVVLDEPTDGALLKMKRHQLAKPGQVILSEIWGKKGAVGLVPPEGGGALCTSHFFLFDVRKERVESRWLQVIFSANFLQDQLGADARGSTGYAAVRPKTLLACEIPLPPLAEQRRIVQMLEPLAAQIAEARALRQASQGDADALLDSEIERTFSRLRSTVGQKVLASFDPHVTSGPRNWSQYYAAGGRRFYRVQDIGPEGTIIDGSRQHLVPPSGGQGRSAQPRPGDLLIVITGATVGRVALFKASHESGFVSQHVAICRLPRDRVLPEFALWALLGPEGQRQLVGQRYGQGKPGLNLDNIRKVALPLPPIRGQQQVVEHLDRFRGCIGALRAAQGRTAAELDALTPSILDKAFKGEL